MGITDFNPIAPSNTHDKSDGLYSKTMNLLYLYQVYPLILSFFIFSNLIGRDILFLLIFVVGCFMNFISNSTNVQEFLMLVCCTVQCSGFMCA